MIYQVPVLKPEQAAQIRQKIEKARWLEGKKTAGISAAPVKTNQEMDQSDPAYQAKLPAGHLVVYSAGALHEVKTVTRGTRIACFFWIQSLVPDERNARS